MTAKYKIRLISSSIIVLLFVKFQIINGGDFDVSCVENGRFYRANFNLTNNKKWTTEACSRYFLCLDGEVFDFRCSNGLHFDVERQICNAKEAVNNCDISTLRDKQQLPTIGNNDACDDSHGKKQCLDGTCLPIAYFCDGSIDCPDSSDEENCLTESSQHTSAECDPSKCRLPTCFCSRNGIEIPGGLQPEETPQMVVLTFDDAVNYDNFELFAEIFAYKNPNNCPIRATFFISHQFNNYQQTQRLWNWGHEIGVHSVTYDCRFGPSKLAQFK